MKYETVIRIPCGTELIQFTCDGMGSSMVVIKQRSFVPRVQRSVILKQIRCNYASCRCLGYFVVKFVFNWRYEIQTGNREGMVFCRWMGSIDIKTRFG